MVNRLIG